MKDKDPRLSLYFIKDEDLWNGLESGMVPSYLKKYKEIYEKDPKKANLMWWKEARMGLMIHYGLYSQLGKGEWVQHREAIPVAEYGKLYQTFNPENFDADFITDLALEAGMSYINLVTCHHEGFALWKSQEEPFNAFNRSGRDFVFELKDQCEKKGLGFFLYFTFLLNWRFPYHLSPDILTIARPDYQEKQAEYLTDDTENYKKYYYPWVEAMVTELLRNYGEITGLWLDIILAHYIRPDLSPYNDVKTLVKKYQPGALLAFKQGADGTEDFATAEQHFHSLKDTCFELTGDMEIANKAEAVWEMNQDKHNEICATLQEEAWGYKKGAKHKSVDEVIDLLGHAAEHRCNLLLNVGPLADGSLHPEDIKTLKGIGNYIRVNGWPEPKAMTFTKAHNIEMDN